MKKLKFAAAILSACLMVFVSCGGGDDAKKLSAEEQFKVAVSKALVDNAKLIAHGLTETKNTVQLSNYGQDLVLSLEVGEPLQSIVNSILTSNYLEYSTQWLKSVQVSASTGLTDNAMKVSVKAGLNNTDILSVNIFEDSKNSTIYFSIPELIKTNFKLSEQDFGFSVRQLMNDYLAQVSFYGNAPEEAVFTGFIEEIVNAIASSVNQVSRSTEELKAGLNGKSVAANYTLLSARLNEDAGNRMASSIENVIRTSTNFNTIANWLVPVISKVEGYKIRVKDFTEEIAEEVAYLFEDLFYYSEVDLKLYVDAQSNLAGIRVDIEDEGSVLACMPQKGGNFGYTFAVAEGSADLASENIHTYAIAALNGYGSYSGGKMTGDFKVYAEGEEVLSFETKALDITQLKSLKANGSLAFHPKAETREMIKDELEYELDLDSSLLSFIDNLDFSINMSQKDYSSASLGLGLTSGNSNFLSMNVKSTISKPGEIKMPSADIKTLDEDSIEDYEDILSGISTSGIVANLKKAKVAPEFITPLESLTGEMLGELVEDYLYGSSSYNYYDDYDYYDYW